jgi:hypothetical protein
LPEYEQLYADEDELTIPNGPAVSFDAVEAKLTGVTQVLAVLSALLRSVEIQEALLSAQLATRVKACLSIRQIDHHPGDLRQLSRVISDSLSPQQEPAHLSIEAPDSKVDTKERFSAIQHFLDARNHPITLARREPTNDFVECWRRFCSEPEQNTEPR